MQDSFEIEEIPQGGNQFSIEEIPTAKKSVLPDFMQLGIQGKQHLYHPGFPMSIVQGINEGGEAGTNAMFGKETKLPQLPQDEWESGGRSAGRFIGGMAPAFGVAAPIAMTGGALGIPGAEALGFGAGAFATTPGTTAERGLEAAKMALVPPAVKFGVKAVDRLIATPLSNFLEKVGFKGAPKTAAPPITPAQNIQEMESQLEEHNKIHSAIEDAEKEAKRLASIETGKASPEAMRYEKGQIEQKQGQLPPSTEMNSIEEPYHLEKNLVLAQEKLDNLNNVIDTQFSKGLQHDVRTANRVFDTLDNERKKLSEGYAAAEKNYEDKNVTIEKTKGIDQAFKELSNSVSPRFLQSPEGQQLLQQTANMGTHEIIPAKNFIAAIRSARDLSKKMRDKQYAYGTNAEERLTLNEEATHLEDKVDEFSKLFKKTLGKEDAEAFEKLQNGWATRVRPLQRNKVYQTMRFEKRLNWDLIKELRGDIKGNDIIKAAIKSDPETLKLVLGQRYFEKPDSLFNPNETTQEYLDHAPQIKDMLNAHKALSERISSLKELKPGVHGKAKEMTSALFKGQEFKQRTELLNKHIENLEKAAKQKNISLKQKVKIQNDIKAAKGLLPEEEVKKPLSAKEFLGVSIGDLVPPHYKVPYKASKFLINKLLGRGK